MNFLSPGIRFLRSVLAIISIYCAAHAEQSTPTTDGEIYASGKPVERLDGNLVVGFDVLASFPLEIVSIKPDVTDHEIRNLIPDNIKALNGKPIIVKGLSSISR